MSGFTYNGAAITLARYADVPYAFRPGGKWGKEVQEVIDGIEKWDDDEDVVETVDNQQWGRILPTVVSITEESRMWGIHEGHRARRPQLSPFARIHVEDSDVRIITVELTGTTRNPLLTRAYGGEYAYPLPWMTSAKEADGGIDACTKFWQSHAYLQHRPGHLIRPGTATRIAPEWYTGW